jgi:hypothetical protein
VIVAASHHDFQHADTLKPILSALLAVDLWPLLLLGINLRPRCSGAWRDSVRSVVVAGSAATRTDERRRPKWASTPTGSADV